MPDEGCKQSLACSGNDEEMYVMSSVNSAEAAGCSLLFHGRHANQLDPAFVLDALPMLHVHNDCSTSSLFAPKRLLRFGWSKLKRAVLQLETKADQTSKGQQTCNKSMYGMPA